MLIWDAITDAGSASSALLKYLYGDVRFDFRTALAAAHPCQREGALK